MQHPVDEAGYEKLERNAWRRKFLGELLVLAAVVHAIPGHVWGTYIHLRGSSIAFIVSSLKLVFVEVNHRLQ